MSEPMEIENGPEQGTDVNGISNPEKNSEQAQNSEENKPKKKRFEIKRWTAVAFWSWDQTNERCAICRNHLMEPCIECNNKLDNGSLRDQPDCPRAVGRCNHSFHLHCISTWIKTRNSCPLDSTEWALKEVVNNK